LESIPSNAIGLYASTTNLFQSLNAATPSLKLFVNDSYITNGAPIILKQTRVMRIRIENNSDYQAERASLDFSAPLIMSATNVVPHGEWTLQPLGTYDDNNNKVGNMWHWPERDIPSAVNYHVASLEISTNFPMPVIVCEFYLRTAKAKLQRLNVILAFGE
jgi:hypothetical protein